MVFFFPSAELFRSKHLQPGYFVNNRNELVLTIQFLYFLVENSDILILFEPECLNSLHIIPKELVLCTSGQKISLKPDEEFDFLTERILIESRLHDRQNTFYVYDNLRPIFYQESILMWTYAIISSALNFSRGIMFDLYSKISNNISDKKVNFFPFRIHVTEMEI